MKDCIKLRFDLGVDQCRYNPLIYPGQVPSSESSERDTGRGTHEFIDCIDTPVKVLQCKEEHPTESQVDTPALTPISI